MKRFALAIFLFLTATIIVNAQNARKVIRLDENSIVKDSSGLVYPGVIWKKMIASGEYRILAVNPRSDTPGFLIAKLPEAELDARFARMTLPVKSENFKEGEKINLFSAEDIDGKKLKSKELAGKVVVINFWFIGCPPCRTEIPALNDLALKYRNDPDVVFIAIALDGEGDIRRFVKSSPFNYHLVSDGKYFAGLYRIHLFPTNLVLDKGEKCCFTR